jgi:hypothetical protein
LTSAANSSCAASWTCPGASRNVSANQAIISASIASFLARRPADNAKLRTRLGSTIRASMPALRGTLAQSRW